MRSRSRHLVAGELVVERGPQHVARRRAPLHLSVDAWEVDGPHDTAVAERVGVAVHEVGVGEVTLGGDVVADERDLRAVAAERRARQRQPLRREFERLEHAVAPRPLVAGVVDLVEDHHAVGGQPAQRVGGGAGGHLLVGGDEAVDVAGEPLPGRPVGVELEAEPVGGERPLDLQVAGGRDDHEPAADGGAVVGPVGQRRAGAGERERRLARARGGDREEVGRGRARGTGRRPRAATDEG